MIIAFRNFDITGLEGLTRANLDFSILLIPVIYLIVMVAIASTLMGVGYLIPRISQKIEQRRRLNRWRIHRGKLVAELVPQEFQNLKQELEDAKLQKIRAQLDAKESDNLFRQQLVACQYGAEQVRFDYSKIAPGETIANLFRKNADILGFDPNRELSYRYRGLQLSPDDKPLPGLVYTAYSAPTYYSVNSSMTPAPDPDEEDREEAFFKKCEIARIQRLVRRQWMINGSSHSHNLMSAPFPGE